MKDGEDSHFLSTYYAPGSNVESRISSFTDFLSQKPTCLSPGSCQQEWEPFNKK